MAWLSMRLAVDGERAEAWADALMDAGALSVSIEDRDLGSAAEEPQFGEPGMADPRAWKRNWVVALLAEDSDIASLLAQAGIPADTGRELETVEEQDWVRLTQSQFDPIPISERLWIVPSWHEAPDAGAISIVLDPGLAFGTGSHPTTRLCLRWLEAHLRGGESLLDYGCGSGILAIAAVKLGADPVVGVDIDLQAVEAARDNAQRNRVEAAFCLPEGLDAAAQYTVLVANILTNPLKALAPLLAGKVRPNGRIALSGILESQADEVMAIYAIHFEMRLWAVDEGWVCLEGVRRC
ncbi:MAG: 50S ribosomal protein L11 methyltransferase [Hydrogenophilales bacterium]|nr:50S ribosomal protein L11 methyltransferase [Hydrogenophilales bacterium]